MLGKWLCTKRNPSGIHEAISEVRQSWGEWRSARQLLQVHDVILKDFLTSERELFVPAPRGGGVGSALRQKGWRSTNGDLSTAEAETDV